ncbi:hormone-sensitive lipase [Rhagoletis pomonella]|uniref:hormone-sensitive lipase n=1 Tax=Rhagoletis pomonella TaxID=28610 RepID=UPI00177E21DA|nr:hormone-sensitive lipase [Rhagoletis pomonella]XP_036332927.1 hormone-sensitive lipase [Rhagoletis pomonella]XP_036332928.1 hormone-sensitive lipase [Rhagoletis pomonella]XP_036332929.1 hormone-sensitive lipase [Rhagoletis pomonella]
MEFIEPTAVISASINAVDGVIANGSEKLPAATSKPMLDTGDLKRFVAPPSPPATPNSIPSSSVASLASSAEFGTSLRDQRMMDDTTDTAGDDAPPALLPIYAELLEQCVEHADYFRDDPSERGQRLYAAFVAWQDFIRLANKLVLQIDAFAYKYDFDEHTPGNGYRSFISVTNSCITYGQGICKNLHATRATMFFRKKYFMKEVESCSQLLSSLCTCLQYLLIMHDWSCDSGDLFANGEHTAEELFEMGDTINQYAFYGRCLGFQYDNSIRGVLRFIAIGMASFSEVFYAEVEGKIQKTTRGLWTGSKYFLNPEQCARRIVNISQNAKIDFCKAFWFLAESEMMHTIPTIVGSSVKVNRVIEIPPEPLQLPRVNKSQKLHPVTDVNQNDNVELIDIPLPSAHIGPGNSVKVRLLSFSRREGMIGMFSRSWRRLPARSRSVLFHCHGGGFVAQSSKSHELYLRDWAAALDVPIISVDYSLAPEAPFPRALEEVFYAYCWMLRNTEHLGTTAERIVLAGDSAGANLCIGVALKCIEQGVRVPDGLFLAYCPTLISFVPSPARLLCLMDPLLPFGFMMRCLRAYASPGKEQMQENVKHTSEMADIREATPTQELHFTLQMEKECSAASSRRTSAAKSPLSSVAENSKWDQMLKDGTALDMNAVEADAQTEESSDTFASASYHSQTVERTDLPSAEEDNSLCVSFEDDSQPIVHYPIQISAEIQKDSDSEQYIDRFLDKYLIDTNTQEAKEQLANGFTTANGTTHVNSLTPIIALTESEENIIIDTGKEVIAFETLHCRFNNAFNALTTTFDRYTKSSEIRSEVENGERIQDLRNMDALIARSPSVEFAFQVPKDPFLSPYWASDEWLSQLPTTKILTLDMDPCLDDCVMFARKLKKLGRPVTLEILNGLPHGFLNFTMYSSEARDGSKRCIKSLEELLSIPADIPLNPDASGSN